MKCAELNYTTPTDGSKSTISNKNSDTKINKFIIVIRP